MKVLILFLSLSLFLYSQTYTKITLEELSDSLSLNAYRAKTEYINKPIEITGELYFIDINGDYLYLVYGDPDSLYDDSYYLVSCNDIPENEKQKILNLNIGDIVTIRGTMVEMSTVMSDLTVDEILLNTDN